jgi:hypothetical protein
MSKRMIVANGELDRIWKEAVIAYFKVQGRVSK